MPSPYQLLRNGGWNFPDRNTEDSSIPELFIIESMSEEDEVKGFQFEGVRLAQILRLGLFKPKYFYVQDERELELLVPVFRQSSYRYLHLSCHGDSKGFILRDGNVSFRRFAKIFDDSLKLCRLFVSACEAGQKELAHALHSKSRGIQSVMAPRVKIDSDHAAAIWSAFYLSLLQKRMGNSRHKDIISRIASLVKLFPWASQIDQIPMSFLFSGYASNEDKGKILNSSAWRFLNIDRSFNPKPKSKQPTSP